MGDIHIRNVLTGSSVYNGMIDGYAFWMWREILEVGRWTEVEKDADDAWDHASNILISSTDFVVATANSHVITSATGGFESSMEGLMITLLATNDGNRGIYNITKVLTANSILIDSRNRGSTWSSDESGITGRIHKASNGHPLALTDNYFVMQAPVASGRTMQIHAYSDGSATVRFKLYPLGDYATTKTDTGVVGPFTWSSSGYNTRFNAFFPDAASADWYMVLYYYATNQGWVRIIFGDLTNVAVGDSTPGFINSGTDWDLLANEATLKMLNENNLPTSFYPTFYKNEMGLDETYKRESYATCTKINGGLAKVFKPLVVGGNTSNGGFIRGNTPNSFCNYHFWNNEFGSTWWKMGHHALLPRNGASDPRPLASSTW